MDFVAILTNTHLVKNLPCIWTFLTSAFRKQHLFTSIQLFYGVCILHSRGDMWHYVLSVMNMKHSILRVFSGQIRQCQMLHVCVYSQRNSWAVFFRSRLDVNLAVNALVLARVSLCHNCWIPRPLASRIQCSLWILH